MHNGIKGESSHPQLPYCFAELMIYIFVQPKKGRLLITHFDHAFLVVGEDA